MRVGYTSLSEVVSDLIAPTTAILQEALNMVRHEINVEQTSSPFYIFPFFFRLAPHASSRPSLLSSSPPLLLSFSPPPFFQVVENHYRYKEDTCSICNTLGVAMLVQWLLTIPRTVQPWLAARLCHLCTTEAHNRQQCCSVGLLRVVVQVLAASQEEGRGFSEEVEGQIAGVYLV